MKKRSIKYFFYIFLCKDKTLYSGICKDLKQRELAHNSGKGSAYVRSRGGGKIIYSERLNSKSAALQREAEVKKLSRLEKLALTK